MYLLELDPTAAIIYIGLAVLAIAICIFITRYIFRIDTMVHYMKVQSDLLIKIAKYNNVPTEEINNALGIPTLKSSDNDFDDNVSSLIRDSGTSAAIAYVMNLKGTTPGSARTYVDELIEKRNLTPKK